MCRSHGSGEYRRCPGVQRWTVNRESHPNFEADPTEERHWKPEDALLSMTVGALQMRRARARKRAAEVDSIRTIHGLAADAALTIPLREELWAARAQGSTTALAIMANRFRQIAATEGIDPAEVGRRHQSQKVVPNRLSAGQRLHDLVVGDRPDWVDEERLVECLEPPSNGTPSQIYLRRVTDNADKVWVLLSNYDGSDAMAYADDDAGLMTARWEALERVRAMDMDAYDDWLFEHEAGQTGSYDPYAEMGDADFLANTDGFHLTKTGPRK